MVCDIDRCLVVVKCNYYNGTVRNGNRSTLKNDNFTIFEMMQFRIVATRGPQWHSGKPLRS